MFQRKSLQLFLYYALDLEGLLLIVLDAAKEKLGNVLTRILQYNN